MVMGIKLGNHTHIFLNIIYIIILAQALQVYIHIKSPPEDILLVFRERGGERKKEMAGGGGWRDDRETSIGSLLYVP